MVAYALTIRNKFYFMVERQSGIAHCLLCRCLIWDKQLGPRLSFRLFFFSIQKKITIENRYIAT